MRDKTPLIRLLALMKKLSELHFGATVKELADDMQVSEKTIRRDLLVFQKAGFPLTEFVEARGRKKWKLEATKGQPGLQFSFDEAIALYMGRQFLEPLAGTPFWEAAQQAFQKIRLTFGARALDYLHQFDETFHLAEFGQSNYSQKVEVINAVQAGMKSKTAVAIRYRSLQAQQAATYDVHPYGLACHQHALYLIGWSPHHQEIRHWKIDRIESATNTKTSFEKLASFDLKKHFAKSFGIFHGDGDYHVKVRFSAFIARYVAESEWHPSQRLTPQPDGTLIAEYDINHTEEIKRWILGFGSHATVLGPAALRAEIAREATTMLNQHR